MKTRQFFTTLFYLGLAALVLLLGHYGYSWAAAGLVVVPSLARWLRAGRNREAALGAVPSVFVGVSVVILIGLSKPPLGHAVFPVSTQVILVALYGTWLVWLGQLRAPRQASWL